jgi:hypothetical protein
MFEYEIMGFTFHNKIELVAFLVLSAIIFRVSVLIGFRAMLQKVRNHDDIH